MRTGVVCHTADYCESGNYVACLDGRGTCVRETSGYHCDCVDGYTGEHCEDDVDDCVTNDCVHGTCVDGFMTYTCSCDAGYEGDHCQSESRGVSVLMTVCDLGLFTLIIAVYGMTLTYRLRMFFS